MAVPKTKISRRRSRTRRSNGYNKRLPQSLPLAINSEGEFHLSHRADKNGFYNGINTKENN